MLMKSFRLTRRAELDLEEIADYTRSNWGEEQCLTYLDALEECCRRVAEYPNLGRACDDIHPGYFRMEQGRHALFFRKIEEGVLIVRILHVRMLPERHLEDLDEEG
jgi:toxin ParE1/3/4